MSSRVKSAQWSFGIFHTLDFFFVRNSSPIVLHRLEANARELVLFKPFLGFKLLAILRSCLSCGLVNRLYFGPTELLQLFFVVFLKLET